MRESIRTALFGAFALAAAALAACSSGPPLYPSAPTPVATTAAQPTVLSTAPSGTVYGRVTNIQLAQNAPQTGGLNPLGAVVGGVAGAVLGHQIGEGSGRQAATVLGGLGGAALGSQYGRNAGAAPTGQSSYLVTVQTDQGTTRTYQVSAVGDLRVGDPVRVDNGVIYRM